jgi:DeoR family transcriptional regulator of aga operon
VDVFGDYGLAVRSDAGAVYGQKKQCSLIGSDRLIGSNNIRLAKAAADLVNPNELIILDSGTTTEALARQLKLRNIRPLIVITNGLRIALELADSSGISVILMGGLVRTTSSCVVSSQTEGMLDEFRADRLFLEVDGFDAEKGASVADMLKAKANDFMIQVSAEVNILAESSKLGCRYLTQVGTLESAHRLITDTHVSPEFLAALRRSDVEVLLVTVSTDFFEKEAANTVATADSLAG